MFGLLFCLMLPISTSACKPPATVNTVTPYVDYEGRYNPYIKITDHTIKITSCGKSACHLFTSVSITAYNPLQWAVKGRVDCIYKLDGRPFDKFVGQWLILPAKSKIVLTPIEHGMMPILDGPTQVTISCGLSWQPAATVNAYNGGTMKSQMVKTSYAKSITATVIPTK